MNLGDEFTNKESRHRLEALNARSDHCTSRWRKLVSSTIIIRHAIPSSLPEQ
jgi:hypothetical protein